MQVSLSLEELLELLEKEKITKIKLGIRFEDATDDDSPIKVSFKPKNTPKSKCNLPSANIQEKYAPNSVKICETDSENSKIFEEVILPAIKKCIDNG